MDHRRCCWTRESVSNRRRTSVAHEKTPCIGPVIFRFKKSNFPFQKKGNSVSIPFHYWQR